MFTRDFDEGGNKRKETRNGRHLEWVAGNGDRSMSGEVNGIGIGDPQR